MVERAKRLRIIEGRFERRGKRRKRRMEGRGFWGTRQACGTQTQMQAKLPYT